MGGSNMYIYIALAVLVVLFLLMLFQYICISRKLNHLYKKYKYFMTGEEGVSLERKLSAEVRELRDMTQSAEQMVRQQQVLSHVQDRSYQKVGLIKYDAFDDTGDKLSFSLTLLDGTNNGFVLSTLVGRETSRIYAKKITAGQCRESLSSEEAESINIALQNYGTDEAANMVTPNAEEERNSAKKKSDPFQEFAFLRENAAPSSPENGVKHEANSK